MGMCLAHYRLLMLLHTQCTMCHAISAAAVGCCPLLSDVSVSAVPCRYVYLDMMAPGILSTIRVDSDNNAAD